MSNSYFDRTEVLIIADAGKNFIMKEDSDMALCLDEAKNLARSAQRAGANVVKFQAHVLEDEKYVRDPSRHEWIKKNEDLTPREEFWKPLSEYCKELGITFCVTPMSRMAAEKLKGLVDIYKIGSADIVNEDLLHYVAAQKVPLIISSGMSTSVEIDNAVQMLKTAGADFSLLHCTSIYPCPIGKLNLANITSLIKKYPDVLIGFSDHSSSTKVPAFAVKEYNARIIEKHFTLDQQAEYGPDHKISLCFREFKEMTDLLHEEIISIYAHGVPEKQIFPEEQVILKKFRHEENSISSDK